jgi:hypothetical protein
MRIRIQESQNHVDPTDQDPAPDTEHCHTHGGFDFLTEVGALALCTFSYCDVTLYDVYVM